jgi:hypothetical protein
MMDVMLYRYEDTEHAAPFNEFGESRGRGTVRVTLSTYRVVSTTPKGAWIRLDGWGEKRFVLATARRRFACSTVEEAYESFVARKRRQISIYRARIDRAERALVALARESGEA